MRVYLIPPYSGNIQLYSILCPTNRPQSVSLSQYQPTSMDLCMIVGMNLFTFFYLHESFIFYLHESFTFFLLSFQIFLKPLLALQAYWLNVNSYLQSPLQLVNTLCINIITTNSYNIRLSYQHTQMFSIWDVHTSL